jgi:hypothetical protein
MLRLGSAGLGYTVSLTGKSLLVWLAVKNLEGKQTRSGKATFVVETFRSFQNFQSSQCACRWFAYLERENSRDDFGAESSVCP